MQFQKSDRPLTLEYSGECVKLVEVFNEIVRDVKSKQMELSILATLCGVEPADRPDSLWKEIVELQSPGESERQIQ